MIKAGIIKLNRHFMVGLFTLLFCAFFWEAKTEAATDIRVGLKSIYFEKSIITIYNTDIKMGYCINDEFKADIELKSIGGFSFEPDKADYYSDGSAYSRYSDAEAAVKGFAEAYVCYAGRKKWLVYVKKFDKTGGDSTGNIKSGYSKVSGSEVVSISFGQKKILIDGSITSGYPQFQAVGKEKYISLGSRKYRGRIEIGRYGAGTINAINIVNIESYLLGVVSCEMNSTWHSEAQKAQAVAARSYCLANTGFNADSYLNKGYVIVDTDESQVYGGVNKETEISKYAVKATLKQVLKSNGKIVPAYFFSTSGGATEFSSDIWGGNSSVFIGVFDEYETNPERGPWVVKTTFYELESKLINKGYNVKGIKEIYPDMLSDSGRVSSVKVKYNGGSVSVKGSVIKSMYGMHSTKFKIITKNSDDYSVYLISAEKIETNEHSAASKKDANKTEVAKTELETSDMYVISGTGQISKLEDNTDQMAAISSDNMTNFPIERPGDDEIWFLGMGWGHGIGMSQSGAYGLALKGYDYKDILKYYYNNTEIGTY
ncbi:MAG: SpoIID/LytB domain-containing protein [Lachnospiraceae bacterium]|nr:SpoIID/LytB domain-containing protein [Lachnospiraceae bacterium]